MKINNQCISKSYYTYLSTTLTLLLIFFFTPVKSEAASLSLGIYPPLIKIQTSPNSHIQQHITISNYGSDPIIVNITFKMFKSAEKKNGEIVFLPNSDKAKDFFTEHLKILDGSIPINQVLLSPKQHKSLSIDINTPKEKKETDYYISVLFISNNTSQVKSNESLLSEGIANNVLLSILPQPSRDLGYIKQFTGPHFADKDPLVFFVEAGNQGNHFISANGKINIVNMLLGSKETIKLQPVTILANSSRYMTDYRDKSISQIELKHGFLFGIYKADVEMYFGKNPKAFHRIIYFYSYPIIGFGVTLLILIFIGIISFKISRKRG
ncbi:MAG TPA: hypothetical protein VLF89_07505 [Candidatus Saccharimonadales bacterium]|nr:hypothetical protein [Candidatus Saccharimonadales bacterium]